MPEARAHETSGPSSRPGWWARLTSSRSEAEAHGLREEVRAEADPEVTLIDRCTPGERVVVRGIVRSVTVPAEGGTPAVEIDLDDGSGRVRVVWLGRRRIPGIDPGRAMVVRGRLARADERPTIYNPRYELKPSAG
jgi:RecG-like helicase